MGREKERVRMYELRQAGDALKQMKGLKVFLGGSCGNSRKSQDWRHAFYNRFEQHDMTFITPLVDNFPDPDIDPAGHVRQVQWERAAMDACDVAIFWLGEGLSNQASRVEIGYVLGKDKTVFIGASEGFLGMEHLTSFSGLMLSVSVDGLMHRLQSFYLQDRS